VTERRSDCVGFPRPSGGARSLPPVDVSRLVGDISRTFNPLSRGFELEAQARHLQGGMVQVSFVLPEGMTRAFVALLESLFGLVRFVDQRAQISAVEVRAIDLDDLQERKQAIESYRLRVCDLFDRFMAEGMERKEAVKRVNQTLKAEKHPWATHDLVSDTLRKSGRFRKARVPSMGGAGR